MSDNAMEFLRNSLHKCEYHRLCGLNIISFGPGFAEVIMEPRKEVHNPLGVVHGGAIFTLCDLAAGAAAAAHGQVGVTQCSSMNFLRPGKGSHRLTAKTTEIKKGRTTGVYQVVVTDEDDEMVAIATMTMFFIGDVQEKFIE